jgi:hypothetical protein
MPSGSSVCRRAGRSCRRWALSRGSQFARRYSSARSGPAFRAGAPPAAPRHAALRPSRTPNRIWQRREAQHMRADDRLARHPRQPPATADPAQAQQTPTPACPSPSPTSPRPSFSCVLPMLDCCRSASPLPSPSWTCIPTGSTRHRPSLQAGHLRRTRRSPRQRAAPPARRADRLASQQPKSGYRARVQQHARVRRGRVPDRPLASSWSPAVRPPCPPGWPSNTRCGSAVRALAEPFGHSSLPPRHPGSTGWPSVTAWARAASHRFSWLC